MATIKPAAPDRAVRTADRPISYSLFGESSSALLQIAYDVRMDRFRAVPPGIENAWISLMSVNSASGSAWTDAYLAA